MPKIAHSLLLFLALAVSGCAGGEEKPRFELAFGVSSGAGGTSVQAVDEDGGLHALTEPVPGRDSVSPAWSPDGKRLAFAAVPPGDELGLGEVFVREEDGEQRGVGNGIEAHWLPDGRRLLVLQGPGEGSIVVRDAAGGPEQLVDQGDSPALSRDGRRVAYVRAGSEGSAVAHRPVDGGPVASLPRAPRGWIVLEVDWLPDRAIDVMRQNSRTGRTILESVPLAGGAGRRIQTGMAEEFALSPTGVPAYANGAGGLVVGPRLIAVPELGVSVPLGLEWSPDGRELAFYGGGQDEIGTNFVSIFVLEIESAQVRRLARVEGIAAQIAWNPGEPS